MGYDVFGMCNPLYDIQAEVPDSLIADLGIQKGSMQLIDSDTQHSLIAKIGALVVNAEPGGSGANTMIGIAQLGGRACFTGKVAKDEYGRRYVAGMVGKQVDMPPAPGEGVTGRCVVLTTPDAERTMCTFLGICRELAPADVDLDALRASRFLYVTGYLWDTDSQRAAVVHAMREARAAGVKVALSLSDPFCVHRNKADLLRIVRENVDLVIGNAEEAQAMTDTENPQDALRAMTEWCDLAALTMDSRGSLLREGDRTVEIPAFPVTAVDTTGAGDMYAAGLLYGLTQGLSLEKTGRLAAYVAAQVVSKLGPRLEEMDHEAVGRICALAG